MPQSNINIIINLVKGKGFLSPPLNYSDSAFNYAEIDESTAEEYQKEYDKIQEDKINNMNNNIDI